MTYFKKHHSNQKGRLLFSSEEDRKGYTCEVYEHTPQDEELHYYSKSTRKPKKFIKDLMKYKSKEEQLLATDNFLKLYKLIKKVHTRRVYEKSKLDHKQDTE